MSDSRAVVAAYAAGSDFHGVERTITLEQVIELLGQLQQLGHGYLEIRPLEREFPVLTMGFRHASAVIHQFVSGGHVALLCGDGSVPDGEQVEVPIAQDLSVFTGEFAVRMGSAQEVLLAFLRGAAAADLGEWYEL